MAKTQVQGNAPSYAPTDAEHIEAWRLSDGWSKQIDRSAPEEGDLVDAGLNQRAGAQF